MKEPSSEVRGPLHQGNTRFFRQPGALVGKIFGEPEPMAAVDQDVYAYHCEVGAEDVFAMPIVGGLLGHHHLVQSQRAAGGGLRGVADVFAAPGPVDAILGDARAEGRLARKLVGKLIGCRHAQVMLMRAPGQRRAPLQCRQTCRRAGIVDCLEDRLRNGGRA